jgi:hypothetical protein
MPFTIRKTRVLQLDSCAAGTLPSSVTYCPESCMRIYQLVDAVQALVFQATSFNATQARFPEA